jgi:hypothetical protein
MTDNKTSYNNTNYASVKPLAVMVDSKTSYNNTNYAPVKPQIVECLRFDRGIVRIVVIGFIVSHDWLRFDRGIVRIAVTKPVTTIRTMPLSNLK